MYGRSCYPTAAHSSQQDTAAAIALLAAFAVCLCAVYWRTALKVILIAALALVVYGTVVGIDTVISVLAAHHH
jgi:hypothetical protein